MTRLLISTAFAALLAFGGAALAQPDQRQDDHRPQPGNAGQAHPAPPPRAARPEPRATTAQAAPAQPAGRDREDHRPSAGAQNAPAAQPTPRNAMRGPAPNNAMRGPAPSTAMRAPNTAMRGAASNRDFSAYHRNFTATRRFHAATYQRPRGWYAHRWTYGEILPALFWASDFWLNDFNDYGLEPPPPGTVWVRDGGDAILIDRISGEIIQVDYGVFY